MVEEKVDGANSGISFTPDGEMLLQSRGHYLRGGPREKHFAPFKQWAACHEVELFCALGARYVMYGEWLYAKHTVFYDALPHYFMEFDILDTERNEFLSTHRRRELLAGCPIESVLVLHEGTVASLYEFTGMITRSHFITPDRDRNLARAALDAGCAPADVVAHTDPSMRMEGLYVKVEEDGRVVARHKYVRSSFTNSITEQDEHWLNRPIVRNALKPGAYERMFEPGEGR